MQANNSLIANISWRNGQPYSTQFDDVYFSSDDSLAETNYVFLQGNDLENRFKDITNQRFTIIETGFGTGLNFLCAAQCWLNTAPAHAQLHYLSLEKYPLNLLDMKTSHAIWPNLAAISTVFLAQYNHLLTTEVASFFEGRIQLELLIGDANNRLNNLNTRADAWFLDGFAPAKNPSMWQPSLFEHMARLSHSDTTLATFTSAGAVRRGLMAAGFNIKKRTGFGKKREMLIGNCSK